MDRLLNSKEQRLKEVDLSIKKADLPDLTGISREEIFNLLANRNGTDHEKLINALDHNKIEHIESFYTKNIYVRNCDWNTLYKISNLVNELKCDLTVSGGGVGEFVGNPLRDFRFPGTEQRDTIAYHKKIVSSCPARDPERSVKIGIIDSGCSLPLYNQIVGDGNIVMHSAMIDATNPNVDPPEVPYKDCFGMEGHGTGVVEIVTKCVIPKTEIYVANVGISFSEANVEVALLALFRKGVKVFNCSMIVAFYSE